MDPTCKIHVCVHEFVGIHVYTHTHTHTHIHIHNVYMWGLSMVSPLFPPRPIDQVAHRAKFVPIRKTE